MIESMSHLSAERLAALASEQPTSAESAHLAGCRFCAAERDSHVAIRRLAAAEIARDGAPLTEWNAIAASLRASLHPEAQVYGHVVHGLALVARGQITPAWDEPSAKAA